MIPNFEGILSYRKVNKTPPQGSLSLPILGCEFWLLPQKALFRPDDNLLIISDLHIGKAAHFRKHGIAVPALVNRNNFWNLSGLFDYLLPERVLFLGDLSHSDFNAEWRDFADFLALYPAIRFELVTGNHDILSPEYYAEAGIISLPALLEDRYGFIHDGAARAEDSSRFYFSGHIHPAVRLYGKARQSARVPCFWMNPDGMVLPAFGDFTGKHTIEPAKSDRVFVIAGNKCLEV